MSQYKAYESFSSLQHHCCTGTCQYNSKGAMLRFDSAACCWTGQQTQDGGETVQLLLHKLWQLLILLVPGATKVGTCQQKGFDNYHSSNTEKQNHLLHLKIIKMTMSDFDIALSNSGKAVCHLLYLLYRCCVSVQYLVVRPSGDV